MKKQNKKGKGWREEKESVVTPDGIKKVAPRHREVAIKEALKDTERVPMAAPDPQKKEIEAIEEPEPEEETGDIEEDPGTEKIDVPLLPAVSDEQAEKDKFIIFNFAVPSSKTEWLMRFAEKNHLEVSIEGTTCGHAEILESYFLSFMEAISTFEDEFEEEMRKERDNRDAEGDR